MYIIKNRISLYICVEKMVYGSFIEISIFTRIHEHGLFALAYSWLQDLVDCLGCSPKQSIFPTKSMELERYYSYSNIFNTVEYLTPLRAYDLCRADEEGMNICSTQYNLTYLQILMYFAHF